MLCGKNWFPFAYNFALRKFNFRGQWSATYKNRGRSKKTQGRTDLKRRGGSLPVGTYLQGGSAPEGRGYRGGWRGRRRHHSLSLLGFTYIGYG